MTTKKGKTGKSRKLPTYKSYLFIDKDPVIDALRTGVQASGKNYQQVQDAGGPAYATLRGWFHGSVRRPQFCTVAAAANAIGKPNITVSRGKVTLSD